MLSHRANVTASALLAVMACAAARVLFEVPFTTPLAIHFDAAGNPNGWAPAWIALALIPLIALGLLGLAALLPKIGPRSANLFRSQSAVQTIFLAVLGLLTAVQLVIVAQALHVVMIVARIIPCAVGLLLVFTGNVLGKMRWNYTIGIRTPWTLANERVWDHTHRFAGRLFVAIGALVAIGVWWKPVQGHEAALMMTGAVAIVVLPVLRSYQLWKAHQA
ncbi:DUF1648 domain-containing protein [Pseudoduganella eburnea]|uniref:DUF1648 domain-containing protein n=1 Tax=Massilia eburnea TaxID=1776165 RepID=A0A6L6QPS7_9BURK|nr:SdpI family protein [Massilia eburnea]MTW14372.1 DUF1648 domain-containing protein [Massilia eburnea]